MQHFVFLTLILTLSLAFPASAKLPECDASVEDSLCISQFKALKRLSRNGSPEALVTLGILYSTGQYGLEKDNEKAAKYLRKAAKKRSPLAQTELAKMYLLGLGVDQDKERAMNYLDSAIKLNYDEAKALKALIVLSEPDLAPSERQQIINELASLSATKKTDADYFLGKYYITAKPEKAHYYLTQASLRGHEAATTMLDQYFEGKIDKAAEVDFNSGNLDIERITVTSDYTFKKSLDTIIDFAKLSYGRKTTGSRLSGKSCIEERTCHVLAGEVGIERVYTNMQFLSNHADILNIRRTYRVND